MSSEQINAVLRQSLDLSIGDIKREHPNWSKTAIDDYFYKQSNINSMAVLSDDQTDEIDKNTQDIANNKQDIETNAENLANHINKESGAHAASAISYDNTDSGLVADNSQAAIDEVDFDLTTHEALTSAHGVAGNNVGTEDYASSSIGGVVLEAANVTDAVASTVSVISPDAIDLPTVLILANETKAEVNQLVTDLNNAITQLNAFLAANQTSKQMAP
tara:strand:- start:2496 stop:3149 length:654 start_codon:yes stop_codon:yes gene_type:complete